MRYSSELGIRIPVVTDHPALGAGAGMWQGDRLAPWTVAPQSSAGRRHTGNSAAGPSSQTLDHSGGRGYDQHTRWRSVSAFRVQGADPWLSSVRHRRSWRWPAVTEPPWNGVGVWRWACPHRGKMRAAGEGLASTRLKACMRVAWHAPGRGPGDKARTARLSRLRRGGRRPP
jgi:hypothetical protein